MHSGIKRKTFISGKISCGLLELRPKCLAVWKHHYIWRTKEERIPSEPSELWRMKHECGDLMLCGYELKKKKKITEWVNDMIWKYWSNILNYQPVSWSLCSSGSSKWTISPSILPVVYKVGQGQWSQCFGVDITKSWSQYQSKLLKMCVGAHTVAPVQERRNGSNSSKLWWETDGRTTNHLTLITQMKQQFYQTLKTVFTKCVNIRFQLQISQHALACRPGVFAEVISFPSYCIII